MLFRSLAEDLWVQMEVMGQQVVEAKVDMVVKEDLKVLEVLEDHLAAVVVATPVAVEVRLVMVAAAAEVAHQLAGMVLPVLWSFTTPVQPTFFPAEQLQVTQSVPPCIRFTPLPHLEH